MSRPVSAITNVTTYAALNADATWTYTGGYMPCPDEVVIRQVTYSSDAPDPVLYLIQCPSLGIIGSVVSSAAFTSNPETRIRCTGPISGPLTFQLFTPTMPMMPATVTAGDLICIHMDFIKY